MSTPPYGNPRGTTVTWVDNRTFLNKVTDASTGLTDVGARWYDTSLGKFISLDPVLETTDTLALGGYAYTDGNPVGQADPTGQMIEGESGYGTSDDSKCNLSCATKLANAVTQAWTTGIEAEATTAAKAEAQYKCGGISTDSNCGSPEWLEQHKLQYEHEQQLEYVEAEMKQLDDDAWPGLAGCVDGNQNGDCVPAIANGLAIAAGGPEGDGAGAPICGGDSFTADTKVLTSSGKAVPIASLKVGDKVMSADTATGKNQVETVDAVLVHHDTNLYNLTVDTGHGTEVIHATANHLIWDLTRHAWIQTSEIRKGDRLLTENGATARADSGSSPDDHTGWMWDLTVHDLHAFYVEAGSAPVLVHNAGPYCDISALKGDEPGTGARLMADPDYDGGQLYGFTDTNNPDFIDSRGRTYDAVGGPTAWTSPKYNEAQMINSIRKHIYLKSGFNYTVLDLTGASSDQVDAVFSSLDSWENNPSMTPQNQLIILGDGY